MTKNQTKNENEEYDEKLDKTDMFSEKSSNISLNNQFNRNDIKTLNDQ